MSDQRDHREDEAVRARVRDALDSVYRPAPGLVRRCAEAVARSRRRPRFPPLLGWAALALVAAIAGGLTLVQHQLNRGTQGPVATPPPSPTVRQLLYGLTATNTVVAVDRSTLRVRWQAPAAALPTEGVRAGSMMALSRDGTILYVLPPASYRGGTTITLLDSSTGRRLPSVALGTPGGAEYHAIAVDPRSGNVFVVGQDAGHILVTVVDPARRLVLATQVTRTLPTSGSSGDDVPYQASFSPDGTRFYYSYAGTDADRTGIDWADGSGVRLVPCTSRLGAACIPGPGEGFVASGDRLLFPDSSRPPQLVETTRDGAPLRHSATGLAGTIADVVLDPTAAHALAVATCPDLGGLSSVDVTTGRLRAIVTPAPTGGLPDNQTVCGERTVGLGYGALAVSRLTSFRASPQSPGEIDVVDVASGRITLTLALHAEVADLLAPG